MKKTFLLLMLLCICGCESLEVATQRNNIQNVKTLTSYDANSPRMIVGIQYNIPVVCHINYYASSIDLHCLPIAVIVETSK